jgi:hypothetical protein
VKQETDRGTLVDTGFGEDRAILVVCKVNQTLSASVQVILRHARTLTLLQPVIQLLNQPEISIALEQLRPLLDQHEHLLPDLVIGRLYYEITHVPISYTV